MTTPTEVARFLAMAARAAPSADNSQPIQSLWDGRRFSLSFSQARGAGKLFGANAHPVLIAAGASIENADLAAKSLGMDLEWNVPARASADLPYASASIDSDARGAPDLEHPLFLRHTNRFPYRDQPIPAAVVQSVAQARIGNCRIMAIQDRGAIIALAAEARRAAEARFVTRELHEWLMSSLRFSKAEVQGGDGLDVATLHLPPGGVSFLRWISSWRTMQRLNALGAYKMLALTETLLLRQAPTLFLLVGPKAQAIEAGRLLENAWVLLNSAGIGVHPYYVVTDQLHRLHEGGVPGAMVERIAELERNLHELLGLARDEFVHMILRTGVPKMNPQRSMRLPLDRLYTITVA